MKLIRRRRFVVFLILMIEIIPSVLTNSATELKEMLSVVEGAARRVHVDMIDGVFANNKTIEPIILKDEEADLLIDYHLMVKRPESWVEKCVGGQADRIIGQIEMMKNQKEFVARVQEVGAKVGLAIDLKTPTVNLDSVVLSDLDLVLLMSVKAGLGGQKFHPEVLSKIKKLDEIRSRDRTPFKICVDGGVSQENIAKLRRTGVDEAVVGRRLFKGDLKANIEKYKKAAYF